jgi:hypothetical protein
MTPMAKESPAMSEPCKNIPPRSRFVLIVCPVANLMNTDELLQQDLVLFAVAAHGGPSTDAGLA